MWIRQFKREFFVFWTRVSCLCLFNQICASWTFLKNNMHFYERGKPHIKFLKEVSASEMCNMKWMCFLWSHDFLYKSEWQHWYSSSKLQFKHCGSDPEKFWQMFHSIYSSFVSCFFFFHLKHQTTRFDLFTFMMHQIYSFKKKSTMKPVLWKLW